MKLAKWSFYERLEMDDNMRRVMRHVEKLDSVSFDYEVRWGVNVLPEYANNELREKWDRQWQKLNDAIAQENEPLVDQLTAGCIRAWAALEAHAIKEGHAPREIDAWEVQHPDSGTVYRIVKNRADAQIRARQGVLTYTLEEVARILEGALLVNVIKEKPKGGALVKKDFDFLKGDDVPF